MPTFVVDVRGAKPINGHTGEPEVTTVATIEAGSWFEARSCAARRFGIDPHDPAMLACEIEPKAKAKP